MDMGNRSLFLIILILLLEPCAYSQEKTVDMNSPSERLQMSFRLGDNGTPMYSLDYCGNSVIRPARMGFELKGVNKSPEFQFNSGFVIDTLVFDSFDETWDQVWGEERQVRNHYNEMVVHMIQEGSGRKMSIRFRLFDDGLGFRYEFPSDQTLDHFIIKEEMTEFALAGNHLAWWIPADHDTQEYLYTESRLDSIDDLMGKAVSVNGSPMASPVFANTVQTSLQMRTDDGLYINIHEAALVDYPCMHLLYDEDSMTLRSSLTPDAMGWKGRIQTPGKTPWRCIQVSSSAVEQLASRMVLNLNEPCALESTDWIHPVKYMGVWWEMISGAGDWAYSSDRLELKPSGRHSANNANVRKYIDFAAENGFDALLVEGWNTGWEDWESYNKEEVFDFQTPNPDFDIKALNRYARKKGIRLMMHHETAGSVRAYERCMDDAYALMNKYGYDAVKSGYAGIIIPYGEHHFGQWMNNHYLYAVKKAADYHIMVNAHEAVRPTGLCRTYPNMIGNESARGTEYQAFGGIPPGHTTILQFTRLNGGPMDYTPGIFEQDLTKAGGNSSRVLSTIGGQLSLYVTMYSPLQMAADLPCNYSRFPDAFQFIKDVAVDWEQSIYLAAEPNDYVVIARKPRQESLSGSARSFSHGKDTWFVGGTTDEKARAVEVCFDFLTPGKTYEAVIYSDGEDADYRTAPQSYTIERKEICCGDSIVLRMAPGGGFAISLKAN